MTAPTARWSVAAPAAGSGTASAAVFAFTPDTKVYNALAAALAARRACSFVLIRSTVAFDGCGSVHRLFPSDYNACLVDFAVFHDVYSKFVYPQHRSVSEKANCDEFRCCWLRSGV